ncbi:MAG: N-acetylmuramic acid 6-phosphate etherase [Flavobacteriales bacterium]
MTNKITSTESESNHQDLEHMPIEELLHCINSEDHAVPAVVEGLVPKITKLVSEIASKMEKGGRLFYIGAGTSGRLGIVDASECPPTFGVPHELVVGIIAGGDSAIRKAVEFAEDDQDQGWKDLLKHSIESNDVVVGIAASGSTPYVIGALKKCQDQGITTACITCNAGSKLEQVSDHPLVAVVGPEVVTGSTRMKAGTAQKLILNMISTATMVKIGRVKGNKMVDMQLSNNKLVHRGVRMIQEQIDVNDELAKDLLTTHGSVRKAVEFYNNQQQ